MAKPLTFDFDGRRFELHLQKVDRSQLYGFKETEAVDDEGRRCEIAKMAPDGKTLVGRGGTTFGYLAPDGCWRDPKRLQAVDAAGDPIEPVPSSFSAPLSLDSRADVDEYLEHKVRAVYHLQGDEVPEALRRELAGGGIYTFPFSYRGGLEPDQGFLLADPDGELWLALGQRTDIEFVGLEEGAEVEEGAEEEDEGDLMDFGMM